MTRTPDQNPESNEPSEKAYRIAGWLGSKLNKNLRHHLADIVVRARENQPAEKVQKPGTEKLVPEPYRPERKGATTAVLLLMHQVYRPGASMQHVVTETNMDEATAVAFKSYYIHDVNDRLREQSGNVVIAEAMHATPAGHGSHCRHCGVEFTGGFLSKIVAAENSSDLSISPAHFDDSRYPLVNVATEPKGRVEVFTYTPLDEHHLQYHDQTPDAVRVVNDLAPIANYHVSSVEVEHPKFKLPPSHPPTVPMPEEFR